MPIKFCEITTYELIDATIGLSVGPSGLYVIPSNISAHQLYSFKIKFTTIGNTVVTTDTYTLDVGCTQATVTDNSLLTTEADVLLDSGGLSVWLFDEPVIDPSYCQVIVSNNIVEAEVDGVSSPSQVVFQAAPSTVVDLADNTVI